MREHDDVHQIRIGWRLQEQPDWPPKSKSINLKSINLGERLHGHVEEDGEQELVVNGHGNEATLVEFGWSFADDDAQPDAPHQDAHLHCNDSVAKSFKLNFNS